MAHEAPYLNTALPIEKRVEDLLSRMTLEEKVAQTGTCRLEDCLEKGKFSTAKLQGYIDELTVGSIHNFQIQFNKDIRLNAECVNIAQKFMVENTRLGIPAIITGEGIHGHMTVGATVFPHSIALSCSWNPALVRRIADVIARESRAVGVTQILSPVLDLAREPRWGRFQEQYGEDPYLASRLGVAYILGLQGDGPPIDSEHVAATPKHFVGHGVPESGINLSPMHAGWREMRETYFKAFEAAIREGKALSIMPSYNEIDGIPVARSKEILTGVLREEWGFQGYTYSDWDSVQYLHTFHKTAESFAEAGRQAIEAGMDMEALTSPCFGKKLLELVSTGKVDEAILDEAVRRILWVKFQLGLFENPYVKDIDSGLKFRNRKEHRALALEAARESVVLLKNEEGILPLAKNVKSIAVIGPNADKAQMGNYSGDNERLVSVLQGIRERAGSAIEIRYAEGCGLWELSTEGIPEAVEAAKKSDVAVVVLGESNEICEEGVDQNDLVLAGVQLELTKAVHATGTPTVVVLVHGRSLAIQWIAENVPAILDMWYMGEEGGTALAEVLFGDVCPSGKLSVSYPRSTGHLPVYYNHKPSARGAMYRQPGEPGKPGKDYVFSTPAPLFEFGHGLSYTEFAYSDLAVVPDSIYPGGRVSVSVKVKNTGKRAGAEVVQLYVRDIVSSVTTPVKALKGFEKVLLQPGEEKIVEFGLKPEDLALLDEHMEWIVEPGEFEILVGGLSKNMQVISD